MENQDDSPETPEQKPEKPALEGREPDGRFAIGNQISVLGALALKGHQRKGPRSVMLAEKWGTDGIADFARTLVESEKSNEKHIWVDKVSFFDYECLLNMARSIMPSLTRTDSGADARLKEASELHNRIEGTPMQTTVLQNPDGSALNARPIIPSSEKEGMEMIDRELLNPAPPPQE